MKEKKTEEELLKEIKSLKEQLQEAKSLINKDTRYFSDNHLSNIVRYSEDAIISKNLDGIITFWNEAAERIYGYTAEEIIGKHITTLFLPVSYSDLDYILDKIKAGEKVGRYKTKRLRKDGKIIHLSLTISPIKNREGVITGASTIARDITERVKYIDDLRNSEDRYRNAVRLFSTIIEFLPDPTFVLDKDRKVIAWNKSIEEFSKVGKESIIGKTGYEYSKVFYDEARPCIIDLVWEDSQIKLEPYYEYIKYRNDIYYAEAVLPCFNNGQDVHIWISASPILDDEGNIIGAIESIRNVTEWKEIENKLMQAQEIETITRISTGVAHEVRNPLNSIMALVEVLNQELSAENDIKEFIEQINFQVERLAHLMNDLLDLGKISRKEEFTIMPLKEICSAGINLWKDNPDSLDYKINLVSGSDKDINVIIDPARFQQIIINLLDNAYQHSPAGSSIKVNIATEEHIALVQIIDEGTGIPDEYMQHIFEPFFTLRNRGTGLGLSIVKNIINNHNGEIEVHNNTDSPGCTFEIRLPLYKGRAQ